MFDRLQRSFAFSFRRMRKGKPPPADDEAAELARLKRERRILDRRIRQITETRARRAHRLQLEALMGKGKHDR